MKLLVNLILVLLVILLFITSSPRHHQRRQVNPSKKELPTPIRGSPQVKGYHGSLDNPSGRQVDPFGHQGVPSRHQGDPSRHQGDTREDFKFYDSADKFTLKLSPITDETAPLHKQPLPGWNYWQSDLTFKTNNGTFVAKTMVDTGSSQLVIPSEKCTECYADKIDGAWPNKGHKESGKMTEYMYSGGTLKGYYYDDPMIIDGKTLTVPVMVAEPPVKGEEGTLSGIPGIFGISMYDNTQFSLMNKILNRIDGELGYTLRLSENPTLTIGEIARTGVAVDLWEMGKYMFVKNVKIYIEGTEVSKNVNVIFDTGAPDLLLTGKELSLWKNKTKISNGSQIRFEFTPKFDLTNTLFDVDLQLETMDEIGAIQTQLKLSDPLIILGFNIIRGYQFSYDFENHQVFLSKLL